MQHVNCLPGLWWCSCSFEYALPVASSRAIHQMQCGQGMSSYNSELFALSAVLEAIASFLEANDIPCQAIMPTALVLGNATASRQLARESDCR